ncbi:hypothetical protein [Heyndrickxia oleronia]|jgi:hypothetical protein|uniref:hypothetical protein n=1 Tax=Heyndrickxia oleronia TaxID=38875 RepID=UPI00242FC993|nr:hypothetical protein [Heyndrickxia oleronia]MCI1592550.1 hypothetical protein [Heyndrickxia oleronia]MCI1612814.1 hypothetical protein [Heyndrickxia oleronia]MCI1743928.1 hypothetical protein [Heyndrickxia oleronia]MCI1760642.1 hypothetical protein [Heyndrickxia oleronia]
MAEITSQAYADLRKYIQSNWQYIELQDETGTSIVRLSPNDSRVTWTHAEGDQTLKLQIVVKGSDSDIVKPSTFVKSAIFNVVTGGQPYSVESFTPFTLEQNEDELTVIHSIQVPKL